MSADTATPMDATATAEGTEASTIPFGLRSCRALRNDAHCLFHVAIPVEFK
jgi:hypothetical protein